MELREPTSYASAGRVIGYYALSTGAVAHMDAPGRVLVLRHDGSGRLGRRTPRAALGRDRWNHSRMARQA